MNNIWTAEVRPGYAWGLIVLVSVFCAWLVYNAGVGYYADKTAMYNSIGNAYWATRNIAIQQRHMGQIGTAAFIKAR
jgi:hypothetical protein